jgi:phage terminase large subunit-like protein
MLDPPELENTLVADPGEVYEQLDIRPVPVPETPNWNILELVDRAPFNHDLTDQDKIDAEKMQYIYKNVLHPMERNARAALLNKWEFWARDTQLAPAGMWTFWLLLAGRGFGKTRTGAEWINERVQQGKAKRIALVAPTAADVRKTMVEGESGILAISPPWNRPLFEPSKLQLTWPNGAIAQLFSAEEPERLRGPQCDTFWADELAAWKKLQETWDMLQFGFRLGSDPRGVITTTPKPLQIVKTLVRDDRSKGGQTAVTRGSTYDNRANLAPKFFEQVVTKYEGTRLGRQELHADILEDMPGALWQRVLIDGKRIPGMAFPPIYHDVSVIPGEETKMEDMDFLRRSAKAILGCVPEDMTRIVVAVDPNVSNTEGSDEIGITVCGKGISGTGYVLADCSMRGSPNEWASAAVIAHDVFGADRVIGEANQGGNMVEHTIKTAAASLKTEGKRASDNVGITLVHATRGKVTRAEPVSALYEQGRIRHVGTLTVLEDQMCLFTSDFDRKAMGYSPDRVDALVWALTHLFHEQQGGSGIFEYIRQEAEAAQAAAAPKQDEELVKMRSPGGISHAYGKQGDVYQIIDGYLMAKPHDVGVFRGTGFVEVEV